LRKTQATAFEKSCAKPKQLLRKVVQNHLKVILFIIHNNYIMNNNLIKLNHQITYNDPNLCEKFNIHHDNESEKDELSDVIYKYDLICIFGLEDFLEEIIIEKISNLYNIMIQNIEIQSICSIICDYVNKRACGVFNKINKEDNFEYFMVLFSYDNLHLFYPCICEFFDKGTISNDKIEALKNNILNTL